MYDLCAFVLYFSVWALECEDVFVTDVYGVLASLNTTVSSRSKSTSVTKNEDDRLAKPLQNQNKSQSIDSSKQNQKLDTKDRKGSNKGKNHCLARPLAHAMYIYLYKMCHI